MDMYGYGTTEQGNYFYFGRQYKFFYCSYVFLPVLPLPFLFFSHGWITDEICRNATSEECGGETPPHPLAMSLSGRCSTPMNKVVNMVCSQITQNPLL